jgi:hypothetical protein
MSDETISTVNYVLICCGSTTAKAKINEANNDNTAPEINKKIN